MKPLFMFIIVMVYTLSAESITCELKSKPEIIREVSGDVCPVHWQKITRMALK